MKYNFFAGLLFIRMQFALKSVILSAEKCQTFETLPHKRIRAGAGCYKSYDICFMGNSCKWQRARTIFKPVFSIYLILSDDVNVKDESPAAYLSQGIRLKIFCPLFLYS